MTWSELPHIFLPGTGGQDPMDRWEFEDQALRDFEALESLDPGAYEFMIANLERWAEAGAYRVPETMLRAPAGHENVLRRVSDPPWLGEIKEAESASCRKKSRPGRAREYRLYFIDIADRPGQAPNQMLVTLAGEKRLFTGAEAQRKTRLAQDRDIRRAMEIGKRWCKESGLSYRPWG